MMALPEVAFLPIGYVRPGSTYGTMGVAMLERSCLHLSCSDRSRRADRPRGGFGETRGQVLGTNAHVGVRQHRRVRPWHNPNVDATRCQIAPSHVGTVHAEQRARACAKQRDASRVDFRDVVRQCVIFRLEKRRCAFWKLPHPEHIADVGGAGALVWRESTSSFVHREPYLALKAPEHFSPVGRQEIIEEPVRKIAEELDDE